MGYKPKLEKGRRRKGASGSGRERTPVQKWEDEMEIPKKKEPRRR